MERALSGTLKDYDLCLTFDDNLRCQYDVAYPVLKRYGITAFWFVYSTVFKGGLDRMEVYRHHRTVNYDSVDTFYDHFFRVVDDSEYGPKARQALADFEPRTHLAHCPFYTDGDRRFRFVRDDVLGPQSYHDVMDRVMAEKDVDLASLARGLWMDEACLGQLHTEGHVIGLHSHTHPTRLEDMTLAEQTREYRMNHEHLTDLLGVVPETMSHPCNSYNDHTLETLRDLKIRLGFRVGIVFPRTSELEYPREDHANVMREMGLR